MRGQIKVSQHAIGARRRVAAEHRKPFYERFWEKVDRRGAESIASGGPPMAKPVVTDHAILRFQQRVADVTADEARDALSSAAIELAINFGAHFVRLGTGQRIVIHGHRVVTVLAADYAAGRLDPIHDVRHIR